MNLEKYIKSTYQGFDNPTEYNEKSRHCEICDVNENKTYFVDNTSICESCYDQIKKEDLERIKIAYNKTNENN